MRNTILALTLLAAAPAFADQWGGFEQHADASSLKPFARDLGGVIGGATFHGGRPLGLSGWDVGVRAGGQVMPHKNDKILRNKGVRAFGVPWVQAEVGMPFGIDGFVRGISYQGLTIAGGGLRYALLKPNDKKWAPQLLLSAVGHSVVHQHFSASHFGANLVVSMGTPSFIPYVGAGFDRVRLVVRSSRADPSLNGSTVNTMEPRGTVGMRWKPWQFVYLNLAGTFVHTQPGAEAGLGVRF